MCVVCARGGLKRASTGVSECRTNNQLRYTPKGSAGCLALFVPRSNVGCVTSVNTNGSPHNTKRSSHNIIARHGKPLMPAVRAGVVAWDLLPLSRSAAIVMPTFFNPHSSFPGLISTLNVLLQQAQIM